MAETGNTKFECPKCKILKTKEEITRDCNECVLTGYTSLWRCNLCFGMDRFDELAECGQCEARLCGNHSIYVKSLRKRFCTVQNSNGELICLKVHMNLIHEQCKGLLRQSNRISQ